jgi:menaquinol-cytochrome c reductase iron-sulfur subunit
MQSRRRMLVGLSVAAGGVAASVVGIPVVGSLIYPLFRKTNNIWRPVGPVDNFAVGATTSVVFEDAASQVWSGVTANTAAWLRRRDANSFIAYKVNCTHLGCPVTWLPDANLFMCPCHGGVFYGNGSVAAGPPRRPLETYAVRVRDGNVEILTGPLPLP